MTQALPVDALLLAEVFDKVPSAIIVLDEQGCVKRANQSASKLLGIEVRENERWVEIVSQVFRPRQDDGHEISTKDGRRLQVSTLDLQQGQLIQMTDLTQTRALQDKIAHMERLSSLGKMAASLAHQIRTPLSAAMLYAANLGNANLQPMARKRFQEKLMGRLEALEAQVSDILMFARSNEQTVTEIDASQLVDQTASNVTAVLAKGDAELETIADTGNMPILGNATALTGALSNLVANAVEAGANKIILRLTKDDAQNSITFSVANNGPAIPEELKQKIFEPFFTSKSSGTGLGLAVVSAVTKVHQGTLRLESWNAEYATVFSITIPLYTPNHNESLSLANTVSSLRSGLEASESLESEAESAPDEDFSDERSNVRAVLRAESTQDASAKVASVSQAAAVGAAVGTAVGSSIDDVGSALGASNQAASVSDVSSALSAAFAGQALSSESSKRSSAIGVGSVDEETSSLPSLGPMMGQMGQLGSPMVGAYYDAGNSGNADESLSATDDYASQGGYAASSDYANQSSYANYADDTYSGESYSSETYASGKDYDAMRSLGLKGNTSGTLTSGTSGPGLNVTRMARPHKRGQIGVANAVLVAAVQRPK